MSTLATRSAWSLCTRASLGVLLICVSACAASAKRARSEIDRARIDYARGLAVERHAPVAFERFQKAKKAADKSPAESVARGDYQAEARLWLETAIAGAERDRLSARRLAEEQKQVELDAALIALARERAAWAREAELRAARAIATSEANKALARAAQSPSLRVKLPREDVRLATQALLTRCELIVMTLESLGQGGVGLSRLRDRLREVEALSARDPELSLLRADQALFAALALFAELRGQDGGPSPEERAALAEELASAGARPLRGDQGLKGVLEHAFADFALVPVGERVIERLCQLAKGHPRGPVLIEVQAKNQAQAEARMRWVKLRFGKAGCEGQRYTIARSHTDGDALETSWVVY
jgi:hypothetical protein